LKSDGALVSVYGNALPHSIIWPGWLLKERTTLGHFFLTIEANARRETNHLCAANPQSCVSAHGAIRNPGVAVGRQPGAIRKPSLTTSLLQGHGYVAARWFRIYAWAQQRIQFWRMSHCDATIGFV